MLGDYSSDIEERTAAAVRELRETARDLEVSRSDYAEMQRAVQLLQVIHNHKWSKLTHYIMFKQDLTGKCKLIYYFVVDI